MTVDMGTLREGDTVKFRNGGEAVVKESRAIDYSTLYPFLLFFHGQVDGEAFTRGGLYAGAAKKSLLDIIEIVPKPFDWTEAKAGMAFAYKMGDSIYLYMMDDWTHDQFVVVVKDTTILSPEEIYVLPRIGLIRAPEHDKDIGG
jgi:gamma-glutamylcyclotransferase (GGCT)/AIG2-like uncharacterized protein YtfP